MVVAPRFKTRLAAQLAQNHRVQWRTASPLWKTIADRESLFVPVILRFTTDEFMENFLSLMAQDPERLGEWKVKPETWRQPAPIPPLPPAKAPISVKEILDPKLPSSPIKLYQPVHQRYYLIAANLTCRIPGFPDRRLKLQNNEQVSFVVRRFLRAGDQKTFLEHAFVNGTWQPLNRTQNNSEDLEVLVPGEQQFPMFPVTYQEKDNYQRQMFAGLVPVSAREAFMNAGRDGSVAVSGPDNVDPKDRIEQLLTVLEMDVLAPWKAINDQQKLENRKLQEEDIKKIPNKDKDDARNVINNVRDGLQTSSWYVLLDFAYYLKRYLPNLWAKIFAAPNGQDLSNLSEAERSLLLKLRSKKYQPSTNNDVSKAAFANKLRGVSPTTKSTTLAQALVEVFRQKEILETQTSTYSEQKSGEWPTTKFLLCGQNVSEFVGELKELVRSAFQAIEEESKRSQALSQTVDSKRGQSRIPLMPVAQQVSATTQKNDYKDDQFVIRCVFQRPHCPSTVHPTVVSQPTQRFQMASYFDPDAPARPIRIPMPIDASPAGLRKFAKNTAFVLSDSLQCQVDRAKSITFGDLVLSVLPWPFRKPLDMGGASCNTKGVAFSKICSFSIPIITICALIVLIIFVQLLDLIFRWVPYLFFCLPIPGLDAKEKTN